MSTKLPKVSFILSAYKRRFLREAIASILAQTYRDFELVVVDDCSPEDLKSVVEEFHDDRLTYYRNVKNIGGADGLVAAWEHAIKFARSEWCILASDDDVYLPECLEHLISLSEKYPQCDLFHARVAVMDGDGRWIQVSAPRVEYESQVEMIYQRGARRCLQFAPDFMFRIRAFCEVGGFVRFPLAWHTDDATWMLLAKNGCAHTRRIDFCFRSSGENISSIHEELVFDKVRASVLFIRWLGELLKRITPLTPDDKVLATLILKKATEAVNDLISAEIDSVKPFRRWLGVIRRSGIDRIQQKRAIYNRFPVVYALRSLVPYKSKTRLEL